MHAVSTVLSEEIVTGTAPSAARVFKDPPVVNWKDTVGETPQYRNTVGITPRYTTAVWIGTGPYVPPIGIRSQEIDGPRRSIVPQELSNAEPLDASINIIPAKHWDSTPS